MPPPTLLHRLPPIFTSLYVLVAFFFGLVGWFIAFVALIVQSTTATGFVHAWTVVVWLLVCLVVLALALPRPGFHQHYRLFAAHVVTITFLVTAYETHLAVHRDPSAAHAEAAGLLLVALSLLSLLLLLTAHDAPGVQRMLGGDPSAPPQLPPPMAPMSPLVIDTPARTRAPSRGSVGVRPAPVLGPATTYAYKAKAVFAYKGNEADPEELSFEKDEILEIASPQGNRWWQAKKKNGRVGIAPSNYLQLL